jgi:hypothetical protein
LRIRVAVLIALFGGGIGTLAFAQSDEQLHVVLPRDAIPSIDRPSFEPAARAKSLDNREPVLEGSRLGSRACCTGTRW